MSDTTLYAMLTSQYARPFLRYSSSLFSASFYTAISLISLKYVFNFDQNDDYNHPVVQSVLLIFFTSPAWVAITTLYNTITSSGHAATPEQESMCVPIAVGSAACEASDMSNPVIKHISPHFKPTSELVWKDQLPHAEQEAIKRREEYTGTYFSSCLVRIADGLRRTRVRLHEYGLNCDWKVIRYCLLAWIIVVIVAIVSFVPSCLLSSSCAVPGAFIAQTARSYDLPTDASPYAVVFRDLLFAASVGWLWDARPLPQTSFTTAPPAHYTADGRLMDNAYTPFLQPGAYAGAGSPAVAGYAQLAEEEHLAAGARDTASASTDAGAMDAVLANDSVAAATVTYAAITPSIGPIDPPTHAATATALARAAAPGQHRYRSLRDVSSPYTPPAPASAAPVHRAVFPLPPGPLSPSPFASPSTFDHVGNPQPLPYLSDASLRPTHSSPSLAPPRGTSWLLLALVEELGWTVVALPLALRMCKYRLPLAGAVVGFAWAAWHLPYIVFGTGVPWTSAPAANAPLVSHAPTHNYTREDPSLASVPHVPLDGVFSGTAAAYDPSLYSRDRDELLAALSHAPGAAPRVLSAEGLSVPAIASPLPALEQWMRDMHPAPTARPVSPSAAPTGVSSYAYTSSASWLVPGTHYAPAAASTPLFWALPFFFLTLIAHRVIAAHLSALCHSLFPSLLLHALHNALVFAWAKRHVIGAQPLCTALPALSPSPSLSQCMPADYAHTLPAALLAGEGSPFFALMYVCVAVLVAAYYRRDAAQWYVLLSQGSGTHTALVLVASKTTSAPSFAATNPPSATEMAAPAGAPSAAIPSDSATGRVRERVYAVHRSGFLLSLAGVPLVAAAPSRRDSPRGSVVDAASRSPSSLGASYGSVSCGDDSPLCLEAGTRGSGVVDGVGDEEWPQLCGELVVVREHVTKDEYLPWEAPVAAADVEST